MSSACILYVYVGALESFLESTNSQFGEIELKLPSENLELVTAAENLSSTERRPHFAEDVIAFMNELSQGHGPQLHEI